MNRDDVIKFIDGKVFYYSDYINFLYKQLELKDNIMKEVREYIEKEIKELYSKNKNCKYLGEIMQLEYILQMIDKENK